MRAKLSRLITSADQRSRRGQMVGRLQPGGPVVRSPAPPVRLSPVCKGSVLRKRSRLPLVGPEALSGPQGPGWARMGPDGAGWGRMRALSPRGSGCFRNPENPENPEDPENPENPENPEDPENPENPEDPENPENPENPEDPEDPPLL
ncbi:IgA FC receptor [Liparis tanakae]|uniref:IgA FC receptor n=1 Tax=Liparis tanakae TaxID=230148 RepID=A0A4Z2EDS8_9TELE|nr:IgA FC receptor [Liparis tanakae]